MIKIISGVIITCVIAAAVIGLGLLFTIIEYSDILGQIFLSLLTVFIAGLFLLNSINAITVGNKLGIFSAFMIIVSAVLILVLIWLNQYLLSSIYYAYFIVPISMVSILLNIIVGNYISLGKSLLAVQIALYICFAYIEIVVSFLILGNSTLINYWQIFITAIIVVLTLYVVLKVKHKNIAHASATKGVDKGEYITITKTEYENLKAEIERLRELTEQKPLETAPVDSEKE